MASGTGEPGLLKIPPELMKQIVKDFDFQEIFTLRKVYHSLRNFIDCTTDFDIKIRIFVLKVREGVAKIKIQKNKSRLKMIYTSTPEGCVLASKICRYVQDPNDEDIQIFQPVHEKRTLLEEQNFLEIFLKDVELFLKFQKSKMEEVELSLNKNNYVGLGKRVLSILRRQQSVLAADWLKIETHTGAQDLRILQCFDPNLTRYLFIWNGRNQDLDLEIPITPHWSNADTIGFCGFTLPVMQHLSNSKRVYAQCRTISAEDLVVMRTTFLKLQTLQFFQLDITEGAFPDMEEQFGFHYGWQQFRSDKVWLYEIGHAGQFFEIKRMDRRITFQYKPREAHILFPVVQEPDFL